MIGVNRMKEILIGVGVLLALFVIFSVVMLVAIYWTHKY